MRQDGPTIENPTQPQDPARPSLPLPAMADPAKQPSQPTPAPGRKPGFRMPMVSQRPARKAARRTRVVIRSVSPLSVLKLSLIFYFCVMLIVYFALLIVYMILSAAGAIDAFGRVLGNLFAKGSSTLGPAPVHIDGKTVFTVLFLAGCLFTVAWSLINVFLAFLYNLTSDIVGGVEVTLAQKPSRGNS